MQKQIRKITNVLSILLCCVLMFGLVPASVFASNENNAVQIGDYYEVVDTTGALPASPSLTEGSTEQSYEDGKVRVNKTISPTTEENVFDITLSVSTQEKIEKGSSSPDAATVLVIDVSGSIEGERLASAKKAAQTFINSFVAEDAVRKIAIVSFSSGAKTVQTWTDVSSLATSSNTILCSVLSNLNADGGTNTEAGMMLGKNLLNDSIAANSSIANIENRNIILLTDGKPTFGVTDTAEEEYSSETSSICWTGETDGRGDERYENTDGNGSSTSCDTHQDVETITKALKDEGYGTYAIYVGDQEVNCTTRDCSLDKSGAEWLAEDCGFTTYSASDSDLDKLVEIFEKIVELIQMRAQAWIVTDPMGTNMEFDSFVSTSSLVNEFVTDEDGTITWDLKNSPRGDSITDSSTGITTTTYTLTYKVKLDTLASGYTAETYYATNGVTKLTYLVTTTNNDQTVDYKEGTAYFNIPSVKGFDGDLTFKKVDEDGNPLANATFTLTKGTWSKTATSDADGNVTITSIPSGHTFTLTETQAPTGYQQSAATYDVTVSYGDVTVTGVEAGDILEFPNTSNLIDIPVTKSWADEDNQDNLRPTSVTVQLYANGEAVAGKTLELNSADGWAGTFTDIQEYKAGQKVNYSVAEVVVPDGYTAAVTGDTNNGFSITNTHIVDKALTIQKLVDGNLGDRNLEFEFTLTLTKDGQAFTDDIRNITDNPETKLSANDEGKYTFTLKHGETIILKIPHGCAYTIEEAASDYQASVVIDGNAANKAEGELTADVNVQFTNIKNGVIDTGFVQSALPFAVLLTLTLAGAFVLMFSKKRLQHI